MEININKKRPAGHWVSQRHLILRRTHIYILTSPVIAPLSVINTFLNSHKQLPVTNQSISSAFCFRTWLFWIIIIMLRPFYICANRTFSVNMFWKRYFDSEVFQLTHYSQVKSVEKYCFYGQCFRSFHRFKLKFTALWKI